MQPVERIIIARSEAKSLGMKGYYTGSPCRGGHVGERFVSSGNCKECIRAYRAAYRKVHPAHDAAYKKQWRIDNAAHVAAHAAAFRVLNAEKIAIYLASYRAKNKDRINCLTRRRHARRINAPGSHGISDVLEIYEAQRKCCAYCRQRLNGKYEVDHIIPLALGGSNARSNLQCLCVTCNRQKHMARPEDFARRKGLLI